jgi:phosphatidylglycerol:prolipoprotein diacylglycerol transferase
MPNIFSLALTYWCLAVMTVMVIAVKESVWSHLDSWTMYLASLGGLIGAWMVGVAYAWLFGPTQSQGDSYGAASIGALAGAWLGGRIVLRLRQAAFMPYAETALPAIALGYAIYRIGCLVNGCCYGTETTMPWGLAYHPGESAYESQLTRGLISVGAQHSLLVHPTQLYHAAAGLLCFGVLQRLRHRAPGTRLTAALIIYGATRFGIEFLRGEVRAVWGPLDPTHVATLVMVATGALLWHRRFSQPLQAHTWTQEP